MPALAAGEVGDLGHQVFVVMEFVMLRFGKLIEAACFVDGNDDEFVVQFYDLGGSIMRSCYNRRSTVTTNTFVPVNSWEFDMLQRWSNATFYSI